MDDCGFRSYCGVRGTGKGKCGHRKKDPLEKSKIKMMYRLERQL